MAATVPILTAVWTSANAKPGTFRLTKRSTTPRSIGMTATKMLDTVCRNQRLRSTQCNYRPPGESGCCPPRSCVLVRSALMVGVRAAQQIATTTPMVQASACRFLNHRLLTV